MNISSLPVSQREHIMWAELGYEPAHIFFARMNVHWGPFGTVTDWAETEPFDQTETFYREFRP